MHFQYSKNIDIRDFLFIYRIDITTSQEGEQLFSKVKQCLEDCQETAAEQNLVGTTRKPRKVRLTIHALIRAF